MREDGQKHAWACFSFVCVICCSLGIISSGSYDGKKQPSQRVTGWYGVSQQKIETRMFLLFAVLKRLHLITSHFFGFMKLPLVSPAVIASSSSQSEGWEFGDSGLFKVHSIDGEPRWNMLTGCRALIVKVLISRIIGGILLALRVQTRTWRL